jgi:hypothetical protein
MAGTILSARAERIPVVVDGFVASASAAVLHAIDPALLDHCLFAHVSAERPTRRRWMHGQKTAARTLACGWAKAPARHWPLWWSNRQLPPIRAWQPSPTSDYPK